MLASAKSVPYMRCFELASQQHHVPLDLLISVAQVESNFDPDARSNAGAHGIMQVRWPLTARHLGVQRVSELYNPCFNIDRGAAYLAQLMAHYQSDRVDGQQRLALAAYHYGPTRLKTEADIPDAVNLYVDRVYRVKDTRWPIRAAVGQKTELNRFRSLAIATRYRDTINRILISAGASVEKQSGNLYSVVFDSGQLSPLDRVRLTRLTNIN